MNQDQLSDSEHQLLLAQYLKYVEMADEWSKRRGEANRFFITVVGGGFAALSVILREPDAADLNPLMICFVAVLGIALCWQWHDVIVSYKRLSKQKWVVVQELERQLPSAPYTREWALMNPTEPDPDHKPYRRLTVLEAEVPVIIGAGYGGLLIWSLLA